MPSITIRDLTIRYDQVLAVNNLALHVEEGEFMVLLGASGSGKTSTLRAIAGLEPPADGEISFGDHSVFSALWPWTCRRRAAGWAWYSRTTRSIRT